MELLIGVIQRLGKVDKRSEEITQWSEKMNQKLGEVCQGLAMVYLGLEESSQRLMDMNERLEEANHRLEGQSQKHPEDLQSPLSGSAYSEASPREAKSEASPREAKSDSGSSPVAPVRRMHMRKRSKATAAKKQDLVEIDSEDTYDRRFMNDLPPAGATRKRAHVNYNVRNRFKGLLPQDDD